MRRLNIHSRANKSAEDLAFESILDDELPLVSSATPLFKKGGQESGPTDKVASRTPGTTRRTTRGTTRGTEKSNMGQHLGQHGTTPGTENELVKTLPGTTPGTHLGQRGTTPGTENAEFNLLKLTVTEERILKFLMAACAFRGGKTSDLIKARILGEKTGLTHAAVRKSVQRMRSKGWLLAVGNGDVLAGNQGGTAYTFRDDVWQVLRLAGTPHLGQPGTTPGTTLGTAPGTDPSSSSSYMNSNFKPTTTADARDGWAIEDLDYSMLTDIGFGRSQASQLRSIGLPFDVVQRSLVYFEFELRYTPSGKSIQEPLSLLMKRMRQNGCWEAPEEYTKRHDYFRGRFDETEKVQAHAAMADANEPIGEEAFIQSNDPEQSQNWR